MFIAESTVRLLSNSNFPNLCLYFNKTWPFYNNSRINYAQNIITLLIGFKNAYPIQVPKRKLYENSAPFPIKEYYSYQYHLILLKTLLKYNRLR